MGKFPDFVAVIAAVCFVFGQYSSSIYVVWHIYSMAICWPCYNAFYIHIPKTMPCPLDGPQAENELAPRWQELRVID